MIINLRGTNGAGKSTIVRAIMIVYSQHKSLYRSGRKKPYGYICDRPDRKATGVLIPGHYEIANGGIDTLDDLDDAFAIISEANSNGYHVLFEGKNMQDGSVIDRAVSLFNKAQIVFVHVNHPVDDCIASVRQRGHSIQEKTIRSIAARVEKNNELLRRQLYECRSLSREDALSRVKELLT